MNRREFVAAAAATATAGLAGCLGRPPGSAASEPPDQYDRAEWHSDVIARVRIAAGGIVLGVGPYPETDGELLALDIETGEQEWSFGRSGPFSGYSMPAVGDAMFLGTNNDAIGDGHGETYALEFDGTPRWSRETGSVYSRPIVRGDLVYVASDDGVVRAFDVANGSEVWTTPIEHGHPNPELLAVSEVVYVENDALFALDPADGEVLWTYGKENDWTREATVADDVVYFLGKEAVFAVADGVLQWRTEFEELGGNQTTRLPYLPAIGADHAYLNLDDRIHALSTDDGDDAWMVDGVDEPRVAVAGDVVYVFGPRSEESEIHALRAASGEIAWSDDLGIGDPFLRVGVVDGHLGDAHGVFASDSTTFVRYDPGGNRTWEWTPGVEIGRYAVDEFVYIGTEDGVRALDPR